MHRSFYDQAEQIIEHSISAVRPEVAVRAALRELPVGNGKLIVAAIGKAAYAMAKATADFYGQRIDKGVIVTKYGHAKGELPGFKIFEAGHPITDENSLKATEHVLELTKDLKEEDTVLFLVSGGGSALFELPLVPLHQLQQINSVLLSRGASITEINCIRKRLSRVKGGRFAKHCEPAKVQTVLLSDIIGDPIDQIASGPTVADTTKSSEAIACAERYGLLPNDELEKLLGRETPRDLLQGQAFVTGNVHLLCSSCISELQGMGYQTILLTNAFVGEAKLLGKWMSELAWEHHDTKVPTAFVVGGESVVVLNGSGKGGRNQETALSAAIGLQGLRNVCMFALGSDGTDGPTDAAGGIVDGETFERMKNAGIDPISALLNHDSYTALEAANALIKTGPTGTNVNDVAVLMIQPSMQ